MVMRFICVLFTPLLFSFVVSAQNDARTENREAMEAFKKLDKRLKGTYQIQMIDTRALPQTSYELLKRIEEERKPNQRTYFNFKKNIRVMVLSEDEINRGLLLSEKDRVIYISEQ